MTGARSALSQRGFALLIVLWTLALLALLGTQLVAAGRSDAQLARNLVDAAVLQAATEGAVQQAIFQMLQPPERRWAADGSVHLVRLGSGVVAVRLEDEGGKVNLNIASEALLRALLAQVGADPSTGAAVAAAIADWRSAGTQPRQMGAKAPQYIAAGRDYAPPGNEFHSVDEVAAVLGMTPTLLARLRPHLTVYSDSDPDGSTRDPVVAAALGDPPRILVPADLQVATIIAEAKGPNGGGSSERVVVRLNPQNGRHPYDVLALARFVPDGGTPSVGFRQ